MSSKIKMEFDGDNILISEGDWSSFARFSSDHEFSRVCKFLSDSVRTDRGVCISSRGQAVNSMHHTSEIGAFIAKWEAMRPGYQK